MNIFSDEPIVAAVHQTIQAAGEMIRSCTLQRDQIVRKSSQNYVTAVDLQVQQHLCAALGRILPGSNIIAEESASNRFDLSQPTWILDPVDGTTNLIHDYRHSAVSIALFTGGQPACGFVYNPYPDEMFTAIRGKGAFLNGRPIHVSARLQLGDSLVGFGTTPYNRERMDLTFDLARDVFAVSREIRRSGAAALDLAYVAAGRLDAFFELQLQPWDFAAGSILVREAGGIVTDWQGNPPGMIAPGSILAANRDVYDELKAIIANRAG